ncbi:MAG TPA: Flp pilus assembly protein CpaB [Gemmatimonadaceae bacterium]|nr:Flp pilus assembly protein CpaB [Gemmatimonadaceae bacterium]
MGGRYKYVFWGALFIAAIATFGAYRYLQANSGPAKVVTKQVVVANADIPEGAAIDRAQVVVATWPAPTVPLGAYASIDSVVGRVTRVNVFNGEAIVPGRLAPAGAGPGLELKIPPGQRAMAVRINDVAGISGLIQPNSRVDVLVTIPDAATGKQVAKLFMENMRVLSVGTDIQRDAQGRPNTATTATLAVTPDEAERLAIAMNTGSIQLVLRGYGDPAAVTTRGANSNDVLSQMRGGSSFTPAPTPAPAARPSPRPSPPPPPTVIIQRPPPPPPRPDSATVDVYRGGKPTPQKFDTTVKK